MRSLKQLKLRTHITCFQQTYDIGLTKQVCPGCTLHSLWSYVCLSYSGWWKRKPLQQSIRTCQCQARGGLASSLYRASTWETVKKNNLFVNKLLVLVNSIRFTQKQHHYTPNRNKMIVVVVNLRCIFSIWNSTRIDRKLLYLNFLVVPW
jgi:hypothetical protein